MTTYDDTGANHLEFNYLRHKVEFDSKYSWPPLRYYVNKIQRSRLGRTTACLASGSVLQRNNMIIFLNC